ncbi:MAG TPA: tripartite tricarboxylate transporter substrate binding protein [Ideonella sp.]|uniref:Bug family tripartite tricarboxylate transporter substrate binding protein n=1 Tax=Ideonella sp. TaxID=1929293 RepID=UPI002BAFBB84|nr:tripartite tricarboxylate transporter substrate binding protein [Ideonella sp.]HSI51616.1 tripartite tricarboxylate transporter substrate binding protein [Ideonella sp.]
MNKPHPPRRPAPSRQRRRLLAGLPLAALPIALAAALASPPSHAQAAFPNRPITLIVPFAPGGIADITARTVAQAMAGSLGQAVVVDNRPSAGGIVGTTAVVKAPADGHTLLLISNQQAVSVGLFKKLPFDVTRDLAPISTLGFFDLVLLVPAESRFKTLKDLVAEARAKPGKLTLGTIAVGSTQQLTAELFKARADIDALIVPYKATPAVLGALRAGEVDMTAEILGPMLPQIKGGVVRALAVTAERRHPALPDVPTSAEAGVADFNVASWNGLAAPAGTPPAVIERLQRAANEAIASAPVQAKLKELGVRPQAGTPAQLGSLLNSEIKHWGDIIRAAKIDPE